MFLKHYVFLWSSRESPKQVEETFGTVGKEMKVEESRRVETSTNRYQLELSSSSFFFNCGGDTLREEE